MLYHIYESQFLATAPLRFMSWFTKEVFSHPLQPISYTAVGRSMAAGSEMLHRAVRQYTKPEWGLDTTVIEGEEVAVHYEEVRKKNFCTLLHFRRDTDRVDPKVLVVAPMSGHHATLLRGTVEALLPEHDVYITDWVNAHQVPAAAGPFHLDEYIEYLINFLDHLGPDVHIMGVCQPGPAVLAAVSVMAEDRRHTKPRSMILMGSPIDTRVNPTQVNKVGEGRPMSWFERHVIAHVPFYYPGFMRRVYPGFMQLGGFMSMNLDRHVDAHMRMFGHLIEGDGDSAQKHREFYDEYLSVMDLPAEFYLDTIRMIFKEHALPEGRLTWHGRVVDPKAITKTALLTVEGEKDDITGPGQTAAAHGLTPNIPAERKHHHLQAKVGHYGVFNGRRWREEILPVVRKFIRDNA